MLFLKQNGRRVPEFLYPAITIGASVRDIPGKYESRWAQCINQKSAGDRSHDAWQEAAVTWHQEEWRVQRQTGAP